MLKPTKAKTVVFLMLLAVIAAAVFLDGSGRATFVPMAAVFWLDGLVQALGAPVSVNGGVDAFNLLPPNALGVVLILLGAAVSLGALYVTAAGLVALSQLRD